MIQKKIGFGEKLSYLLANVGNFPIMTLISAYLMIFYTDIVGLNPAAIATLFILTRVFDGLNDPIMGFIIDHLPPTKMGRFRPYLLIGSIVCALNFLLLWFGPMLAATFKLGIAYISYLLIGITFDLMDIPLNSLIPAMTDDMKQRGALSTLKGLSLSIAGALIILPAPIIIANSSSPKQGYITVILLGTLIVVLFSIVGAIGVKERVQPAKQEKYKFKDIFRILGTTPVLITFLALLFYGMSGAAASNMQVYFATYILGDVTMITWQQFGMALMLPTLLLSGWFTQKFGKRVIFTVGLVLNGIAPLLRLFDVYSIPLLLVSTGVAGIGLGFIMSLMYGVQADNVDYVEWKRGFRAEGQLASVNSFIVKASSGIGAAIPGYILAATGYVANQTQTVQATQGIIFATIVLPGILMIMAGIVFFLGYRLSNREMLAINDELRLRRENS